MTHEPLSVTIHDVFCRCLFRDEELPTEDTLGRQMIVHTHARPAERVPAAAQVPDGAVIVQGIVATFGLHPGRLEEARATVIEAIRRMPTPFRPVSKGGGGGWSFLQLCMTQDGEHWAEHPTMQELVVLAIGLGLGRILMPQTFWVALPGCMPYVVLDDEPLA